MSLLVQEKVRQALGILQETGIDLWLTFVRGTASNSDPVLPLIYGHELGWQGALLLTRSGESIAIVGRFDGEIARRTGAYSTVITYPESIRSSLLEALERLNPQQIAVNISRGDVQADGLTHGMYQILLDYLRDTPFAERIVSSEPVVQALRGRKTPAEVQRVRAAIETTEQIFARTFEHVRVGMTERQVSDFMRAQMQQFGVQPSGHTRYCPIVNTGMKEFFGLAEPGEQEIQPGHVLRIDFGVRQDDYCSDIQRMVYFLRPGETAAPDPVQRGFDTVLQALQAAVAAIQPGKPGREIDAVARGIVTGAGYPDYEHATGHPIGRLTNDGGWGFAPEWPQYGDAPNRPLEAGNVYTVEPVALVPDYGYIGVEENILITEKGAEYISTPQVELIVR